MKIILVRHGETQMNVEGIFFGHLDPELNSKGKEQAEITRELLKKYDYKKIYTSDLKRAKETAKIINYKELELIETKELREINFGIFEGYSYNELLEKYPKEMEEAKDNWQNYNYETGESVLDLQERAVRFIEKIKEDNENLILVSHWGTINTILSFYFSKDLESYWKYSVKNGGLVEIEFVDDYPILKGLNIGG